MHKINRKDSLVDVLDQFYTAVTLNKPIILDEDDVRTLLTLAEALQIRLDKANEEYDDLYGEKEEEIYELRDDLEQQISDLKDQITDLECELETVTNQ
jgi:hypothetical protein